MLPVSSSLPTDTSLILARAVSVALVACGVAYTHVCVHVEVRGHLLFFRCYPPWFETPSLTGLELAK